jgi:hypothetical protein
MLEQGGIYCKRCGRRVPKPPKQGKIDEKEKDEKRVPQKKQTSSRPPMISIDVSKPNPSIRSKNGIWHESPVRKPTQQRPESPPKQSQKTRIKPPSHPSPQLKNNLDEEEIELMRKKKSNPPPHVVQSEKDIQPKQLIQPLQPQPPIKQSKRPLHFVAPKKSEISIPFPMENQQQIQSIIPHKNNEIMSEGCGYLDNYYKANPKGKGNLPPLYPMEILSSEEHLEPEPSGYLLNHGKPKNDLVAEKRCSLPLLNSQSDEEGRKNHHQQRVNHRLESTKSAPPRIKDSEGEKERLKLPPPVRRSHDYESSNSQVQKSTKLPSLPGLADPPLPVAPRMHVAIKPTQAKKKKPF